MDSYYTYDDLTEDEPLKLRYRVIETVESPWGDAPTDYPLETDNLAEALASLLSAIDEGSKVKFRARKPESA